MPFLYSSSREPKFKIQPPKKHQCPKTDLWRKSMQQIWQVWTTSARSLSVSLGDECTQQSFWWGGGGAAAFEGLRTMNLNQSKWEMQRQEKTEECCEADSKNWLIRIRILTYCRPKNLQTKINLHMFFKHFSSGSELFIRIWPSNLNSNVSGSATLVYFAELRIRMT